MLRYDNTPPGHKSLRHWERGPVPDSSTAVTIASGFIETRAASAPSARKYTLSVDCQCSARLQVLRLFDYSVSALQFMSRATRIFSFTPASGEAALKQ